jgi:shikimate kinase
MKIFITGMPGCGKSTFGKKVAEELNMTFFDLDKEIIKKENRTINKIFEKEGEDYFRQLESKCLQELSQANEKFILATGGGTPGFGNNMDFMNEAGITIYINASVRDLIERLSIKGLNKRPLLKDLSPQEVEKKLEDQLSSRKKYYERCKFQLIYHPSMESDISALIRSEQKS